VNGEEDYREIKIQIKELVDSLSRHPQTGSIAMRKLAEINSDCISISRQVLLKSI